MDNSRIVSWSFPPEWSNLRFPWRRAELCLFIKELADPTFQQTEWLAAKGEQGEDGINAVAHFLFDDTNIAENPTSEIGYILIDGIEAEALLRLTALLDTLITDLGDADSATYVSHARWPDVVDLAKRADKVLARAGAATWVRD